MPELPEVESIRRTLAPVLEGRVVLSCEIRHPRMIRYQRGDLRSRILGHRIERVRRAGKYLLAELDGERLWVTHLGMSGRVEVTEHLGEEGPHTRVVIGLDDGREFRLVDPRTFGFIQVLAPEEIGASGVGRLGPDALDALPPAAELERMLSRRRAAIKTVLLDQTVVAGVGNIYADEILHRAGISPVRQAGGLDDREVSRLRSSVGPVLREGLRWNGTSLEDRAYLLPDGRAGEFAAKLRVYGRQDQPCLTCGTPIRRLVIGGRSSFWCPQCQV